MALSDELSPGGSIVPGTGSRTANIVAAAALALSLAGTLFGFAGLLMWGFRAADVMIPGNSDPPDWLSAFIADTTLLNFGLMAMITILGLLNILIATRPQEFFDGGWKRWMIQSIASLIAALIFLNATNVS